MKMQFLQFYVRDWMSDNALRMVSLEARGLWIDMLCLMARSPEYGYLKNDADRPMDERMLSMAVGVGNTAEAISKVKSLLDELENAGVFARDDRMIIYSRRLLRESKARKLHNESQKRYIRKTREVKKPEFDVSVDAELMPNNHKPEASNHITSSHKPATSSVPTIEQWMAEGKRLMADEGWLKTEFIRLNDMNWELSGRPIMRWQSILARFWSDFQSNRNFKRMNPINKGMAFKDILPPGTIKKVII